METSLICAYNNEVPSKLAYLVMRISQASPVNRITALHLTLTIFSLVYVVLPEENVKYLLKVFDQKPVNGLTGLCLDKALCPPLLRLAF